MTPQPTLFDRPRRAQIEACIDRLIAVLDAMDGDPDFEAEFDHGPDDLGEPANMTFLAAPVLCAPLGFRGH